MKQFSFFSRFIACLCVGVFAANSAAALSCVKPNLATTFNRLVEVDDTYVVVVGKFVAEGQSIESDIDGNQSLVMGFEGEFVYANDTQKQSYMSVEIKPGCSGPWCGAFPLPGRKSVMFFRQMSDGYRYAPGACDSLAFNQPGAKQMRALKKCLSNGKCGDNELNVFE